MSADVLVARVDRFMNVYTSIRVQWLQPKVLTLVILIRNGTATDGSDFMQRSSSLSGFVFHAGVVAVGVGRSSLSVSRPCRDVVGAVQPFEPRQGDATVGEDVAVGPLVHPLDQVLLVQKRVVGAQRAGGVEEALVVMAQLRLPAGGQELVDVHHLAQRHHHDGAWTRKRGEDTERGREPGPEPRELVLTQQAGGRRVLLNGLSHVVLHPLPDLPLEAWVQDVEGLHGMKHPVPLVLSEDGVVRLVVPLPGHRIGHSNKGKRARRRRKLLLQHVPT